MHQSRYLSSPKSFGPKVLPPKVICLEVLSEGRLGVLVQGEEVADQISQYDFRPGHKMGYEFLAHRFFFLELVVINMQSDGFHGLIQHDVLFSRYW